MKNIIILGFALVLGLSFQYMPVSTEILSDAEKASLAFMREEEKLARDVYLKLYEKWQLMPFRNIANSEQQHMDLVLNLLKQYKIDDPVGDNVKGVFRNKDLQKLYNELIDRGLKNELEALRVGALIEEIDIADLQRALAQDVKNESIASVYNKLLMGSQNHIRAFTRNLQQRGEQYVPTMLSKTDYDAIIAGKQECTQQNCSGSCKGNCSSDSSKGQGKGKNKGKGIGKGSH